MKSLVALVALASLTALVLAGCTSGGPSATVPQKDEHGRYIIHLTAGNAFSPSNAEVPEGSTVVWINDGGIHDVSAADDSWSSDDPPSSSGGGIGRKMEQGQSFSHGFSEEGDVAIVCTLHVGQGMKMTLHVTS